MGSPRPKGHTMALVNAYQEALGQQADIVPAYRVNARACIDCRLCWREDRCSIEDDMQAIYKQIESTQHVIIASPVYMGELTGPLLSMMSRLQLFFAAEHFRGSQLQGMRKQGVLLLTGGGNGAPDAALRTADMIFGMMRAKRVATVVSGHTDTLPAVEDVAALSAVTDAAQAAFAGLTKQ